LLLGIRITGEEQSKENIPRFHKLRIQHSFFCLESFFFRYLGKVNLSPNNHCIANMEPDIPAELVEWATTHKVEDLLNILKLNGFTSVEANGRLRWEQLC